MTDVDRDKSYLAKITKNNNMDIPNRIQFIKTLMGGNPLEPLIDFDNTDTEYFINRSKDDDASGESYDTRKTLQKKVFSITDVINGIGGTLKYVKSGTTGHTFKGENVDEHGNILYEYAVKVVAYGIKDKYGNIHDTRRPENAELMMIRLLSYFIVRKKTPHIMLPIGTFDTDITHFTNLIEDGFIEQSNERYKDFVEKYKKGEYYDKVSILISEWANRGDFLDFLRTNYKRFSPIHWKVFFFQLISTMAVIQSKFPAFRHNDLKANNILITKISKDIETYKYKVVGSVYRVPNIGYQLKLWDFDFSCIPGVVDNKKVMISNKWSRGINVSSNQNRYYDIHYFFNTLIKKGFFPEILTDNRVPQEVKDFVVSIVPQKYQRGGCIAERGRILIDIEHTTPVEILKTNPYFEEFRTAQNFTTSMSSSKYRSEQKSVKIDNFLKGGSKHTIGKTTDVYKISKGRTKSIENNKRNKRKNRRASKN